MKTSESLGTLQIAFIAILLIGFSANQAKADNRTVDGVIIGATVGSVVGFIVGSEMDRHHYSRKHVYHEPAYHHPSHSRRHCDHRDHWNHSRYNSRTVEKCRDIIVISERRGHYRKSVKTVCRERRR